MNENEINILLIIVFFHPQDEDWEYVCSLGQKYSGYIIDNSEEATPNPQTGKLQYICNNQNLGIAEAQNIGLREAFKKNIFSHVVFFDQDSRVDLNYPEHIAREYESIQGAITNLAMLGPTVKRHRSGKEYKSVIHKDVFIQDNFIQRREVISSGSCISKTCLEKIGFNDGKLFIDYVDFEWCWRAESMGYICGITTNISMNHQVGRKELVFPGGYRVIISSPFRYFYQYRNYVWLTRRKYVPWRWKLTTGIKFVARLIYFPLCVKDGKKCVKNMLKGIIAGLKR